jgi:hypothetical protein
MILPDIIIESRLNFTGTESGMDCLAKCRNKNWFVNYPHTVEYKYNSRGFRDNEWPDDLKNAIWCVGDSFTAGIGSPYNHMWTFLLSREFKIPIINVSMDGGSNDFISRISKIINAEISPVAIIHQWSYTHRREKQWKYATWFTKEDEEADIENFISNVVAASATNTIHSMIPRFEPNHSERTKDVLKQKNII